MKKSVDSKLAPLLGFYVKGQNFINVSFDEEEGAYWIQYGYFRPNGQLQERVGSTKKIVQIGSVTNQLENLKATGYEKTTIPSGQKLRSVSELRTGQKTVVKEEKPLDQSKIPTMELVEGKTVKIASQIIPIREGVFEHVPMQNSAYHFPEFTNDVVLDLMEKRAILLTGHTGCGKTSLYEQIASRVNQPVVRSNMNGQTTVGDFVGMWTVKAGETVWVDGVLPRAMKEGHWLIIDEIDCADASILAVLNAVLEKNGTLTLKEKGFEVIKPHSEFRILATANTVGCMAHFRSLYQGTNIMNEAFLDRFRVYHVNYLPEKEEVQVLIKSVPKIDTKIAVAMVQVAQAVRTSFEKEDMQSTFSTRRLIDWAEMYVRHGNLQKSAKAVIYSKTSFEDASTIDGLIKRIGV